MSIYGRLPLAISRMLNSNSDPICNGYWITIENVEELTIHEKNVILATHTANVNFHSFAAEVEYHAEALDDWLANYWDWYYGRGIRADMCVECPDTIDWELDYDFLYPYYNLDNPLVKAQVEEHSEYCT